MVMPARLIPAPPVRGVLIRRSPAMTAINVRQIHAMHCLVASMRRQIAMMGSCVRPTFVRRLSVATSHLKRVTTVTNVRSIHATTKPAVLTSPRCAKTGTNAPSMHAIQTAGTVSSHQRIVPMAPHAPQMNVPSRSPRVHA